MSKKSFIIDFDNTIGFFDQIIFLINIVESTYNYSLNEIQIGELIDYYPNIFRPKLYDIINLFYTFKITKQYDFLFYILVIKSHCLLKQLLNILKNKFIILLYLITNYMKKQNTKILIQYYAIFKKKI